MNLTELIRTKFLPPLMQGKENAFNEDIKAEYGATYEANEYGSGYVPWIKHTEGDSRGVKGTFFTKTSRNLGTLEWIFKPSFLRLRMQ